MGMCSVPAYGITRTRRKVERRSAHLHWGVLSVLKSFSMAATRSRASLTVLVTSRTRSPRLRCGLQLTAPDPRWSRNGLSSWSRKWACRAPCCSGIPGFGRCRRLPDDVSERIRGCHAGGLQELHMNGWHSSYLSLRSATMSEYEPTSPRESPSSEPESVKTSGPMVVGGLEGAGSASPLPPASSSRWPVSAAMAGQGPPRSGDRCQT